MTDADADAVNAEAADDRDLSDLGRLVAACVDRLDREGPAALDALCARHPARAGALRDRIRRLRDLGLIDQGTLGPYRILRNLGTGGMGVVHLARDDRLERTVALKVLPAALALDPRALDRFRREVRAVARLAHERIVPVHEVGDIDGTPYFTMDHVEGATLAEALATLRGEGVAPADLSADHLRRAVAGFGDWGRSHAEVVTRLVIDVADALAHAHAHDVVHRDVKPANVMLRRDGHALLFDFGLARLDDGAGPTRTGDVTGTPAYMAPEQIGGPRGATDERTDVYALGVTLYELLALQRPFEGAGADDVLAAIVRGDPEPLRRRNPMVPRDLETVCMTAMERSPERRYPSAAAFAADLRRVLALEPVQARAVGSLERLVRLARRRRAATAAIVLAAAIAVGLPVGLLVANAAIREQRDRAEAESERARQQETLARREAQRGAMLLRQAEQTNALLLGILASPAPGIDGREVRVVDALARASAMAAGEAPDIEVALRNVIAGTYRQLGLIEEGRAELLRARAVCDAPDAGVDPLQHAVTLANLGAIAGQRGEPQAAALIEEALALWSANEVAPSRNHARALSDLAAVYGSRGELERGLALLEESLALQRTLGDESDPEYVETLINLANHYDNMGRDDEAFALAEELVPHAREVLGAGHPTTLVLTGNLAAMRRERGDLTGAEALLRDGIDAGAATLGPDHPRVATTRSHLAAVMYDRRQPAEAVRLARDALPGLAAVEPSGGWRTLATLDVLGRALLELDMPEHAAAAAAAAIEVETGIAGLPWPERWGPSSVRAESLVALDDPDAARACLDDFIARAEAAGEEAADVLAHAREQRARVPERE